MSCCSCNHNPCSCNACDPACEPLSSALQNFITAFFGTIQKVCVDGQVQWVLPCNLDEGLPEFPRLPGEGIACYLLRLAQYGGTGQAIAARIRGAADTLQFVPALTTTPVEMTEVSFDSDNMTGGAANRLRATRQGYYTIGGLIGMQTVPIYAVGKIVLYRGGVGITSIGEAFVHSPAGIAVESEMSLQAAYELEQDDEVGLTFRTTDVAGINLINGGMGPPITRCRLWATRVGDI